MARPKSRKPAYCLHKSSNRAYVAIDGRAIYLGRHGTPESHDKYDRLIGEWIARGRTAQASAPTLPDAGPTVSTILAAFWAHAQRYYIDPDGRPTTELDAFRQALKPLRRLYGNEPADSFGPLALRALMEEYIRLGWCRSLINRQAARVRHAFKWAVSHQLLPSSVHEALRTVPGLTRGRTEARESEPVKPVPQATVDATLPHLPPPVAAMVKLQMITGMRPGEVCIMRGCDIDMTSAVWVYRPARHKRQVHDLSREIPLGRRCQDVLKPFLRADVQSYLFSPRDSDEWRRAKLRAERKTPLSCGNGPGDNRKAAPRRQPGERYTTDSYRRSIQYACDKANVTRWHPHQLRHAAATNIRRDYGVEAAKVILGHVDIETTEIYAERDAALANRIMSEIG